MSCGQGQYSPSGGPTISGYPLPGSASPQDSTILIVCDAPEQLPQDVADVGLWLHQRGWWPYSWIAMPCGTFDVAAVVTPPNPVPTLIITSNAPGSAGAPELAQNGGFGWQGAAIDPAGTSAGNKGSWGAKLSYDFQLVNSSSSENWARVSLVAANNGGFWTGPATLERVAGYPQWGMPNLSTRTPSAVAGEITVTSFGEVPIAVLPLGVYMRVSLANGGASTLPVYIVLTNVINTTPPVGPGD